jgi:hypothetical protein
MSPELFEEKVSLYLDAALDAEGIAELNGLLTRPELAARFVRMARIHGSLRELSQVASVPEKAPGRRRPLFWIVPAAAAAAFLLLTIKLSLPGARLAEKIGQVSFDGTRLSTSAASSASLVLSDGTRLLAGADTSLRLEGETILIEKGRVAADVPPRASGTSVTFKTPHAEARGPGSRFMLAVEGDFTHCRVEQGLVRVAGKDPAGAVDVPGGGLVVASGKALLRPEPLLKSEPRAGDPLIRIVAPDRWPKAYKVTHFRKGSLLYGDRGWRISEIPPEVDGALGIVTLAEDRYSREPELLVFEVDRDVVVWVGIDDRAASQSMKLPDWLSGWEDTGLRIHSETASNSYYHLYRKRFPAGRVALGGNIAGGDTGAVVNYTVLVTSP